MKPDVELAWLKATPNERADFVESYSDDIRELLPLYFDRDKPEEELVGHGQDDDGGDDETLDPAELPVVLDTYSTGDDDGDFAADHDEDFRAAKRGFDRRASGKRVPAAPRSAAEIERMTKEFLERGGEITRVKRGVSGVQPPPRRVAAWRQKKVSSNKGV